MRKITFGPGEPGMTEKRKRETELLFLELEGVRKENQGKSTSVPWRNFTPGSYRGQHRFPRPGATRESDWESGEGLASQAGHET